MYFNELFERDYSFVHREFIFNSDQLMNEKIIDVNFITMFNFFLSQVH